MFVSLSYTTHTIISISLHIIGIVVGLFVWYLFPKHPTRSIVQLPSERVAVCIDSPLVTQSSERTSAYSPLLGDETLYSHSDHHAFFNNNQKVEKLIDLDDHQLPPIPAIRNFG